MMPLYGGIKLHLGDTGALHPFGKAYLGYTFMWADDPILDPSEMGVDTKKKKADQ